MSHASRSLRVFISYARSDSSAFAEELMAGLEAAGFDPFLDRHDVGAGEDWEKRLLALLQQADTVVYVLSPASVHSERCAWEVKSAEVLSKRVIPVVAIDVSEDETPEALRRLNYIFFSEGHSFGGALRELSAALRTDLTWVREHTRLADLASYWSEHGKAEELLLRVSELSDAKAWLAAWKAGAPEPTSLHRDFINDSETAEHLRESAERRRLDEVAKYQKDRERTLRIAAGVVAALFMVLVVFGAVLLRTRSQLAQSRADLASRDRALADKDANLADLQTQLNEQHERLTRAADRLTSAVGAAPAASPAGDGPRPGAAGTPMVTPTSKAATVQDLVRQARLDPGWDIDVFWCEGAGAAQNQARARAVVDVLTAERTRQTEAGAARGTGLSFPLGRLRLRPLTEQVNARDGYHVSSDVVRAEPAEAPQADALRAFVNAHQGPPLADALSGMKTSYYLSVFLCRSR